MPSLRCRLLDIYGRFFCGQSCVRDKCAGQIKHEVYEIRRMSPCGKLEWIHSTFSPFGKVVVVNFYATQFQFSVLFFFHSFFNFFISVDKMNFIRIRIYEIKIISNFYLIIQDIWIANVLLNWNSKVDMKKFDKFTICHLIEFSNFFFLEKSYLRICD